MNNSVQKIKVSSQEARGSSRTSGVDVNRKSIKKTKQMEPDISKTKPRN